MHAAPPRPNTNVPSSLPFCPVVPSPVCPTCPIVAVRVVPIRKRNRPSTSKKAQADAQAADAQAASFF